MELGLILNIFKLSLEIFKDERRGRFRSQLDKIEKEWMDEKARPDDEQSDLAFDRMHFDANQLGRRILEESGK